MGCCEDRSILLISTPDEPLPDNPKMPNSEHNNNDYIIIEKNKKKLDKIKKQNKGDIIIIDNKH